MKRSVLGILIAIVAVAGIVGVALAQKSGVFSDKHDTHVAETNESPATGNETAPSAAPSSVAIENFIFNPADITVKKGTQVTWTNKDSAAHNVIGDNGKGPQSGTLSKGESYTFTFNEVGAFSYVCSFHPGMIGKVVVTE